MQPLLKQNPDLWFIDETGIRIETTLHKVVAPRGTRPVVPIRRSKKGVRVIGAWRKSGRFLFSMVPTVNQESIKEMLRRLKRLKGKGRFYVVWDGDGSHTAHSVSKLAVKKGIHLIRQPPCTPEVQPVEGIWRQLKAYLANRLFRDVPELVQTVEQFFAGHDSHFSLDVVNYFS